MKSSLGLLGRADLLTLFSKVTRMIYGELFSIVVFSA